MKTRKMTLSGILLCASICFISCGKDNETFSAGGNIDTSGNGNNNTQIQETAYAFPGAEGAGAIRQEEEVGKYTMSLLLMMNSVTTLP